LTDFSSPKEQILQRIRNRDRVKKRLVGYLSYYNTQENRYEGHHFNKIRALKRDNFTCQCCGFHPFSKEWSFEKKWKNIDVNNAWSYFIAHHLNEDTRDNRLENIVILCNSCHVRFHKNNHFDGEWICEKCRKKINVKVS
jgi:ribosomal protein L37AE/L43A